MPEKPIYSISSLQRFLEEDPKVSIAFYGGEPLLNTEFIERVMENIPAEHFIIQTNATLIKKLGERYWHHFDTILLSIDGIREVTDYYRGRGVYNIVLRAAKYLLQIADADLIARMTVTEKSDIYRDVLHLLSLQLFHHIHWQLDVIWSDRWRAFDKWVNENYIPQLKRLVEWWLSEMETGSVKGIVPFQGIVSMYLGCPQPKPPCGAGSEAYAILTDGSIVACPIAVEVKWARVGNIFKDKPSDLPKVESLEPCPSCEMYNVCGGRCLYANRERYWGEEGFKKICRISRLLFSYLYGSLPKIKNLLNKGIIKESDLIYPKYLNTTEIIP